MKRFLLFLLSSILALSLFQLNSFADGTGDGNIDNGGGGMGSGTSQNKWVPGYDGVRVTVIRVSNEASVSTPVDYTNKKPASSLINFGKLSKTQYRNGTDLSVRVGGYVYQIPALPMPQIISSGGSVTNIEVIKKYFCSEGAIKMISNDTGIDYALLTGGNYKLLLEPIAYFTFEGGFMGMTAHEAALYDQVLNGGLRSKMVSLTHQNLPLSMFLENSDLNFPAWNGSTNSRVSNDQIITSLGLGIVRFNNAPTIPSPSQTSYQYRTDTDVITSVRLSTSAEITPDNPVSVTFAIMGSTYTVTNIVIPEGDSQLVWIKWHTPSTPQSISIQVRSTNGSLNVSSITASIVDLNQNPPPNPTATDRNDSFHLPAVPTYPSKTTTFWGIWSASWHEYWVWISNWQWYSSGKGTGYWIDNGYWKDQGWWDYIWTSYFASLSATQSVIPDTKSPSPSSNRMKSGYGIEITSNSTTSSNAPSSHITGAQPP
ncbi:hypothetical protein [Paenibacillus sp. IHB B 3415]|uniref:hypothetical protein n=1 Tax=Paenibacillus sp. IHB B 3415 TaxID=867080 RepID=UPI000A50F77E|nr:hypothetical protein [Paenibacillus sp. IHB B 3415]